MLAGRVLYGFYGLFAGVLRIARRIVYRPFYLINLAFGFKFLVARDVPGNFLNLAHDAICCAFNVFLIHIAPLHNEMPFCAGETAGNEPNEACYPMRARSNTLLGCGFIRLFVRLRLGGCRAMTVRATRSICISS
jgi:hypothetical protein